MTDLVERVAKAIDDAALEGSFCTAAQARAAITETLSWIEEQTNKPEFVYAEEVSREIKKIAAAYNITLKDSK